jgi:hypothetical protein
MNRLRTFFSQYTVFILSGLVTLCMAILYLSIAPTRLSNANFGGDGGDFLAAVLTSGIPHPTGYPTYTLLGTLFQLIPVSTPVFRGALESAIPAALAAGLLTGWVVYVLGSKSTPHLIAAVVAGGAWGAAPLLFSQAAIVEVHGLQSLFTVLVLWWITLNLQVGPDQNHNCIYILSLLVGLGIGNHITIALSAPAMIIALIYSAKLSRSWKFILTQLVLIFLGTLVYIYLPLSARSYPPINWGNPQTWAGFLWEITGNPYHGLLFTAKATVLWERIGSISSLLMDQYGMIGLAAGAIGATIYSFQSKWLRWSLVWIFLIYSAFAIGYQAVDSVGYLLPAIMVFAIWIGLAVPSVSSLNWRRLPIGAIVIGLLVLSIFMRIPGTRTRVDTREQDQPARYAEQLLKDAPGNAIVNTTTDTDTFPLWYYHFGLHSRPDLRIVVLPLTQFVWYQETLMHTYPDLKFPAVYSEDQPNIEWGKQIQSLNQERPVCNTKVTSKTGTGVEFQCSSP